MAKRGDKVLQAVAVYGGSKSGKNPIFFEKATGIWCMIRYYSATFTLSPILI